MQEFLLLHKALGLMEGSCWQQNTHFVADISFLTKKFIKRMEV